MTYDELCGELGKQYGTIRDLKVENGTVMYSECESYWEDYGDPEPEPEQYCNRCGKGIYAGDTIWTHIGDEEVICAACFDKIEGECIDWYEEVVSEEDI